MAVKIQLVNGSQPLYRWNEAQGRTKLKMPFVVENGVVLQMENGAGRVIAIINCEIDPPKVSCGQTDLTLEKDKRSDYVWDHKGRSTFGFTWLA